MKLEKIKSGFYKDHYIGRHGVIYSEEIARRKFPEQFESPPKKKAVKKAVKKSVKKSTQRTK